MSSSKGFKRFAIGIAFVTALCGRAGADTVSALDPELGSLNWRVRAHAFNLRYAAAIRGLLPGSRIALTVSEEAALETLLTREAGFPASSVAPTDIGETEEYSDYFASVITVVSALGTPEAAKTLLDQRLLVTGKMATDGVVAGGHQIVDAVLNAWDNASALPRSDIKPGDSYALSLIIVMDGLLAGNLPDHDVAALGPRVLAASRSGYSLERRMSTEGLALLARRGDPSARARLSEMAERDPLSVAVNGKPQFPVREKARTELAALAPGH